MATGKGMVDRVLAVLDRCLESEDAVTLAELSLGSGLPKATAWRIAEKLTERGLLARTQGGYLAGAGLQELGDRAAHQASLRAFVLPELVDLHSETSAAVWAVDVSLPLDWVVIAQVYDRAAFRDRYREQWQHDPKSSAILATSLGHVGLAGHPEHVEELLRRGVPRLTRNTEVDPGRILAAFNRANDERQLLEHGRVWLGWSCLAVPILDSSSASTVGVLGLMDRTPRFVDSRISRAAHAAAERLRNQWPARLGVIG